MEFLLLIILITILCGSVQSLQSPHWILQKDLQREVAQCPKLPKPIEKALKSNHLPYGANKIGTHIGNLRKTPKGHFIASFDHIDFEYLKTEKLLASVLKIYWQPGLTISRKNGQFKMTLFEFTQKPKKRTIDQITMDYKNGTNSWYSFDTTDYLEEQNQKVNFFLQKSPIKVNKNGQIMDLIPLGDIGQAQLVIYTHAQNTLRLKRDAKRSKNRKNRKKVRRLKNQFEKPCQLVEQWVSFEDLGWDDWVLATDSPVSKGGELGYHFNFCQGACPFPMPAHINHTNHAVFQRLYNNMMPADVEPPCCIPVEYGSLTLLIAVDGMKEYQGSRLKEKIEDGQNQHKSVEMKIFDNMSAKKCGCR